MEKSAQVAIVPKEEIEEIDTLILYSQLVASLIRDGGDLNLPFKSTNYKEKTTLEIAADKLKAYAKKYPNLTKLDPYRE